MSKSRRLRPPRVLLFDDREVEGLQIEKILWRAGGAEVGVFARGTAQLVAGVAPYRVAGPLSSRRERREAHQWLRRCSRLASWRFVSCTGGLGTYAVDYLVQGVRAGRESFEVVVDRPEVRR